MQTDTLTSPAKHRQTRATHWAAARQDWRHSGAYLELNGETIEASDAPCPCPANQRTVDSVGIVEFEGVVIVVPLPFISKPFNKRTLAFWRSHGFELRTPDNIPHVVENYVWELVRPCDVLLRGRRFSAKAWFEWATQKHKELYS